jgi:putative spermidine/putrescine transport system permease protein
MTARSPLKRLLGAAAILALAYLILPLAVVVPVSLTDQRMLSLPVDGLSLQHYETVFSSPVWLSSAGQSLLIGALSTALALAIGTWSAIGCWMLGERRSGFFRVVNLLPVVVPSIIYALGAYRLFVDIGLFDTVLGVVLVHAVGAIPFVFIAISTSLAFVDLSLMRAARSLGAGMLRAAVLVILPNIKTGLASAAIFAFLHSWDEVVVTLFVSSTAVHTLPRKMWEGLSENLDPTIACVAVVMVLLTLMLLLLQQRAKGPSAG